MRRRPPRSTRTDTLFPYTTLFRSDPLDEVRAPDLAGVAGGQRQAAVELDALLRQLGLDHHLSGDAGVVGARLPQHVAALHALVAAEDVLDRVVQRMAHVQAARHVGRREYDGEGRLGLVELRREGVRGLPAGLLPVLYLPARI